MKTTAVIFFALILCACEPNSNPPNDPEVITTFRIIAVNDVSGDTLSFEFSDPDGVGGNSPVIDTIYLESSSSYHVSLELYNEAVTPVDTITHEIEEEGTDHQFFFEPSGSLNLSVSYNDVDANNDPIGLLSIWTTAASSQGTVLITLKHLDGIPKTGLVTTGDTDVQISFVVVIQ